MRKSDNYLPTKFGKVIVLIRNFCEGCLLTILKEHTGNVGGLVKVLKLLYGETEVETLMARGMGDVPP